MAATSTMMALGTEAPDFSLPDPSGRVWSRDELGDAPGLLVMFICNHCPYVKHVSHELARLTTRWQDRGLAVVGVQSNDWDAYPDDAPDRMAEEARTVGYTFPYLVDESQDVALAYGAACTPDFFLFDGDRRLVYRGQLDSSRPGNGVPVTGADLGAAVDAVLDGRPVSEDQRPSIGCSIKWRPGRGAS
ncbi:MAG: thioredoxin family protein [Acidimicrobiia bacterium]